MHLTILFSHIGPYHIARLKAVSMTAQAAGWQLTALQSIGQTTEHPWGDLETLEGVTLRTLLPEPDQANSHPECSAAVAALKPCLDEIKPDVVAIPGWGFPLSRAALKWCQQHKIPAVLMSESKRDDEKRSWWKEQLKSWLYVRKYASALVGGPAHRQYLIDLGMGGDRIFYGYDVVDNHYFREQAAITRQNSLSIRQAQPDIPDLPYFLAVTRLLPRKNITRLVEAYAHYCWQVGTQQAWHLVICGSGEQAGQIRQMTASYQLNHLVHLPGFLTYQQIAHWYALANAFVHPALVEQWGLVVNEACATGLPILCSQTVGACDSLVQDGFNGFTFNPYFSQELTQSLVAMHQLSEAERLQMGQASQQLVANLAPEKFGQGLYQAVQTALAHQAKPARER
jgi:1,2-diacylglycerol 3-alpha-glucosyltransferase